MSEQALILDGPYDNVWDAIEMDPAERERQKMLADLWIAIQKQIKRKRWTQSEAAKHMGVTQPRVSNLLRGKLDLFSIDSLVAMLGASGIKIELRFSPETSRARRS